jgi:hypothetical protein
MRYPQSKKLLCALLGATVVTISMSATAAAVCMNGYPSVTSEYKRAQYVVAVRVLGAKKVPATKDYDFYDGTMYRVSVEKSYKGGPVESLSIFSENSSGRFPMQVGQQYLLFLYEESGRYQVDNCGNSNRLAKSSKNIDKLKRLAAEEHSK